MVYFALLSVYLTLSVFFTPLELLTTTLLSLADYMIHITTLLAVVTVHPCFLQMPPLGPLRGLFN
jgi:hypothetical protein